MLGWYCFSLLISFNFELNLGSTSLRITGMVFLREEGFGRAMVLEGLAVLALVANEAEEAFQPFASSLVCLP